MSYLSVDYLVFSVLLLFVFYLFPIVRKGKYQWIVLLLGSTLFYLTWIKKISTLFIFLVPVLSSFIGGILLEKKQYKHRVGVMILWSCIIFTLLPFAFFKLQDSSMGLFSSFSIVAPVGLSFYTLQLIAYVVDCYHKRIHAEKNIFKHMLYVTFFPQIIQGPIPRYKELSAQLFSNHSFEYENMTRGLVRIVWGFFMKFMIADKAAIIVNKVFDGSDQYVGGYIILATILYAVQLYTDFYSCTSISLGIAQLFGIKLSENFNRPYLAVSVKDFWRRWHISLSLWLKDYIYIPLGGNKKGKLKKYINILIVFVLSGLWHGSRNHFILWGLIHAVYQIAGDMSFSIKEKIYSFFGLNKGSFAYKTFKRIGVFFLISIAWIFFRANSISHGIQLISDAFRYNNPWSIMGTELFSLGLDYRELALLFSSVAILIVIGLMQEHGMHLQEWFVQQHLLIRWCILFLAIIIIWIFGTYGYGYNTQDFIYGGF